MIYSSIATVASIPSTDNLDTDNNLDIIYIHIKYTFNNMYHMCTRVYHTHMVERNFWIEKFGDVNEEIGG